MTVSVSAIIAAGDKDAYFNTNTNSTNIDGGVVIVGPFEYTGLIFDDLNISPDATIQSAKLFLSRPNGSFQTNPLTIELRVFDESFPAVFVNGVVPNPIPNRPVLTGSSSVLSSAAWDGNTYYASEDFTTLIQALIQRPDWDITSSVGIRLFGTQGSRELTSYNSDPAGAAVLEITYHVNHCLEYDGVDQQVALPADIVLAGDFTVEAWIKPSGTLSNVHGVVGRAGSAEDYINLFNAIPRLYTGSVDAVRGNTALVPDVWRHITITPAAEQI